MTRCGVAHSSPWIVGLEHIFLSLFLLSASGRHVLTGSMADEYRKLLQSKEGEIAELRTQNAALKDSLQLVHHVRCPCNLPPPGSLSPG